MDLKGRKTKAARECLKYNEKVDLVYVTSDLNCFANRNAAVTNASDLADKEIDVFTREELDK